MEEHGHAYRLSCHLSVKLPFEFAYSWETLPGSGTHESGEMVRLHPSALHRTNLAEEQGVAVLTACPAA